MRTIDADALEKRIYDSGLWSDAKAVMCEWIDTAPTVPAVVLPCVPGDSVHFIRLEQGHYVYDCGDVTQVSWHEHGRTSIVILTRCGAERLLTFEDFGKTAFRHREEAEAALKGAEG